MSKRLIAWFSIFCVIAVTLILRLEAIIFDEKLINAAASQSRYTLEFNKTRGQIYDCKLNSFTDTKTEYLASCIPLPENLSLLSASEALKNSDISALASKGLPFIVESDQPELDIPYVTMLTAQKRYEKQIAPHIIGYIDKSGKGITGIEKAYDDYLSSLSQKSSITYTVDGLRRPLLGAAADISYAPIITNGVVLTIDTRIQQLCEEIGSRYIKKGAIVVMESQTGKLRAVASFPSYDVNNISAALADEENAPLINRAFCSYSVGSTFKVVTAAAALSQGFPHDTAFECVGSIDVFGQEFGCHKKDGHGMLTLHEALEQSCNPYFIQLGLLLNPQQLLETAVDLSFSKRSELAPNLYTQAGSLPTLADLQSPAAIANLCFGQGALAATPVQIAQMICGITNGGTVPQPQLIEGFTQTGQLIDEVLEPSPGIIAFNPVIAATIKSDLIDCVMEVADQNAKPQYVSAGGKTGTAQTGQFDENGNELLAGWFAGFFPAESPKYTVAVLAENSISGNRDASPVFAEIADRLYAPIVFSEK